MKAFDSEMITLTKHIAGTHGFKALEQLVEIKNKPIPYQLTNQLDSSNDSAFDFSKKKGIYYYDESKNEMIWQHHADSIVLVYPYQSGSDSVAKFVIAHYAEAISAWGVMVPVSVDLFLEAGGRKLVTFKSEGRLEHQVPVEYHTAVKFEGFSFIFNMKTRLSKKKSRIVANLNVHKGTKPLMSIQSKLMVSITDQQQLLFDKIEFTGEVFPVKVEGTVNYGKISPATTFFADDFNKHADIKVFSGQKKTLGQIELRERKMNDRLGFVLVYTDQSTAFLDEMLLSFREIMNTKL